MPTLHTNNLTNNIIYTIVRVTVICVKKAVQYANSSTLILYHIHNSEGNCDLR